MKWMLGLVVFSLAVPALAQEPGRFAVDTYLHLGELRSGSRNGRVDAMRQLSVMNLGLGATLGERWLLRVGVGSLVGVIGPHFEASLGAEYHLKGSTQSGPFLRAGARGIAGVGIVCINRSDACRAARTESLASDFIPIGKAWVGELGAGAQIHSGRLVYFGSGTYQLGNVSVPDSSIPGALTSGRYQGWLATVGMRMFLL